MTLGPESVRSGYPTKDIHPELAEGLFSNSSLPLAHSTKFIHSQTYEPSSCNSNYSRTHAIPVGWGVSLPSTFKSYLKCRRAGILQNLALPTNSSLPPLCVFRNLRTLSFFGSQLSPALSIRCALFRKNPGVPPMVRPIQGRGRRSKVRPLHKPNSPPARSGAATRTQARVPAPPVTNQHPPLLLFYGAVHSLVIRSGRAANFASKGFPS